MQVIRTAVGCGEQFDVRAVREVGGLDGALAADGARDDVPAEEGEHGRHLGVGVGVG